MSRHSYKVPGLRVPLQQAKNSLVCWAVAYTVMVSWKRQQSFQVEDAVGRVGELYRTMYKVGVGLPPAETARFFREAGLMCEPMANLSVRGWYQLLRRYGLLWVSTRNGDYSGNHARIVGGMRINDDDPRNIEVMMMLIDPASGKHREVLFDAFHDQYEIGYDRTMQNINRPKKKRQYYCQVCHF